nr:maleylpyruvate isomerase family mycothiol-dependent enzyme [Actinophytocola xinjiangensis]
MSNEASVAHDTVPEQRRARERAAALQARRRLADVRAATEVLAGHVTSLDDRRMREPSLLPGWSRAHVVTHLARNADGLVNLLTWARTGVEHPIYASDADREADIEEGAGRLAQVLHEDLLASSERFAVACERLSDSQWSASVTARNPVPFPASAIPGLRLFELWTHLVDLDVGFGFEDIPADLLEVATTSAVARHLNRPEGPSVHLRVIFPDGEERVWDLVGGGGTVHEVTGEAAEVIGWLTGRRDGSTLRGEVPDLPAWG